MEELQAFIGDNPQALEVFNQFKGQFDNNIAKLQEYELKTKDLDSKFTEAVQSRDKVKNLVRETLGVEEISKDAIMAKLSTMGDAEIQRSYEKQLDEIKGNFGKQVDELQSKTAHYEKEINDYKMKLALAKTDVVGQTQSEHATSILMEWIGEGAEFDENGNITYRGPSGETLYNSKGEPLTLEDRIAEIKADKSRDFVFQSRFLNGGGAPTTNSNINPGTPSSSINGGKLIRSQMTLEDKMAYREKYGEAAYQKLPLA